LRKVVHFFFELWLIYIPPVAQGCSDRRCFTSAYFA
jgi:hypothetical protein